MTAMPAFAANRLTARLDLDLPVVQGPFGGGLSTAALAATVSNAGGLGSYGAHYAAPERIGDRVAQIAALTSRRFALNLWVSDHDPGGRDIDRESFDRTWRLFEPWFRELGVDKPEPPARFHSDYEAQVEALLAARPPAFSFVFGIPAPRVLAECRRLDIVTIGAATTIAEAQALDAAGVDAIVASGFEAGGHRPSFLAPAEESLMGTFALVQLLADRVSVPVIAAGGIADARGVRAALALGAEAAQIGTAFLACEESAANDSHRAALFGDGARHTTLTRAFSGRLARGLRNRWTETMAAHRAEFAPFPRHGWFVSQLRPAAIAAGRDDLVSMWAGQIAPNLRHRNAALLMQALRDGLAGATS
jgi:nitronate monooxygenase